MPKPIFPNFPAAFPQHFGNPSSPNWLATLAQEVIDEAFALRDSFIANPIGPPIKQQFADMGFKLLALTADAKSIMNGIVETTTPDTVGMLGPEWLATDWGETETRALVGQIAELDAIAAIYFEGQQFQDTTARKQMILNSFWLDVDSYLINLQEIWRSIETGVKPFIPDPSPLNFVAVGVALAVAGYAYLALKP